MGYGRSAVDRGDNSRTLTACAHQVRPAVHRLDMGERLVGVRHNRVTVEVTSGVEYRVNVVSINPVITGTFDGISRSSVSTTESSTICSGVKCSGTLPINS